MSAPVYSEAGYALWSRARSRTEAVAIFWQRVRITDGCWEWIGGRNPVTGYGTLNSRWLPGKYVHRISYEIANGPVPPGLFVCHHCDNPPCVRPDHLYAGTAGDNARDRELRNRRRRGPRRKLTEDQARAILTSRDSVAEIAQRFDIAQSTVRQIKARRSWGHIAA